MIDLDRWEVERERIIAKHGGISAEILLDEWRDEASPFHSEIDWNAERCAARDLLDQARRIIRLRFVVRSGIETVRSAPFCIRDPSAAPREQGYRLVSDLRGEPDEARRAVMHELTTALSHLRRARDIAAALDLRDLFDRLLDEALAAERAVSSAAPKPHRARRRTAETKATTAAP